MHNVHHVMSAGRKGPKPPSIARLQGATIQNGMNTAVAAGNAERFTLSPRLNDLVNHTAWPASACSN